MKKIIFISAVVSLFFLSACNNHPKENTPLLKSEEIKILATENIMLKDRIRSFELEYNTFNQIQDISILFFKYMSLKQYNKLLPYLSSGSKISDNGDIIFTYDEKEIKYDYSGFDIYTNIEFAKIRGYGMTDKNKFVIHYELQTKISAPTDEGRPYLLHLYFEKTNNDWVLSLVENDV